LKKARIVRLLDVQIKRRWNGMVKVENETRKLIELRALSRNISWRYVLLKRLFDIFLSIFCLLLLLPLFAITSAVYGIYLKKPVLYSCDVYGINGRIFSLYIFPFDCGSESRFGKIAGRWGINRLPSIFNILKGDMSFVGPAPIPVSAAKKHEYWYNLRLAAKPGMTGLWQVSGINSLNLDEMVRMDLKYIRERNSLYDLKIILRALLMLARGGRL
jgi:lipopolysaccharide/colanic/teichoic acid biosynthesis glycosyltransferase